MTPKQRNKQNEQKIKHAPLIAVGACLLFLFITALGGEITRAQAVKKATIVPMIPSVERLDPNKVFLEHADSLVLNERISSEYQVLYGNVKFRKENMFMYCDSAYFYDKQNSLDAFGNVKMEQGDTLFIYGNQLNYNGQTEQAVLYGGPGRKARLIDRDVMLETDIVHYNLAEDVGYYDVGGVLTDKLNRLSSTEGRYYTNTKDAYFYYNVDLLSKRQNDTLTMVTDSLTYNTFTHIAKLIAPTVITNSDGNIVSSSGLYNTNTGQADLFARSTVTTNKGNTLTGDTLFYDRKAGFGKAFGNIVINDTVNKSMLLGDYGFYDEISDSAFVTGNALAKEFSKGDTLYLHSDTINAFRFKTDSTRVTNAFHKVRIYRKDIQGLCDSLSITERDSIMHMFRHPILWNGDRQIYGNSINVHFNDSTVDWAKLPDGGIMGEHIADDCFNQLSGSKMTAWFCDTTITRLYVEGNVQIIMFPMENDSTYNKFAFAESSYLDAYFNENEIERVSLWPETTGNVTPLYLAKKTSYFLPQFKWYGDLRPMAPDEVFDYPEGMNALFASPEPGRRRRTAPSPNAGDQKTPLVTTPPEENQGEENPQPTEPNNE